VAAACQDPQIQRWVGVPSPYELAHAEEWLAAVPGGASAGERATFLAEVDGRVAGSFSLLEIDAGRGYGEIGYWVAPGVRRRGVATRAVALIRDWARDALGVRTIEILVHRDNEPSCGVALRAGFRDNGELRNSPRREDPDPPAFKVFISQA
jgi:RimJ/RimL family protein N-acetyltransferase